MLKVMMEKNDADLTKKVNMKNACGVRCVRFG